MEFIIENYDKPLFTIISLIILFILYLLLNRIIQNIRIYEYNQKMVYIQEMIDRHNEMMSNIYKENQEEIEESNQTIFM